MGKENVDGPLKLLTNNIFNGGLSLYDKTLKGSFKKDVFFKSQFFHPSPPPLCHSLSLFMATLLTLMSVVTNSIVQMSRNKKKCNFCFLLKVEGKI